MSIVKAHQVEYCRFRVPDLKVAIRFLEDFGLLKVDQVGATAFFRGTDPMAWCYSVEEGPQHFLGFAFGAASEQDLRTLAEATERPVEPIAEPGGGWRVRLQEPNGYDVDVVHGRAALPAVAISRQALNTGAQPLMRAGELLRLPKGAPTPVKRLAHVVLVSSDPRGTADWFRDTIGLISSDEVVAGPDQGLLGAFMRADMGDDYVDHHSFFVMRNERAGLQHVSFEVHDVDAVLADHHYLRSLGRYQHLWGIGRHLLGSQLFDYWADPFGYAHEHWADSDRLNARAATNVWPAHEGFAEQYGDAPTDAFRAAARP